MKKFYFLLVLLIPTLCLLAFADPASAVEPETIRFQSANPGFGSPCPEPPDLGFIPIDSYSETLDLMSLDDQLIGSGSLCHFVKSFEATEDNWTQINWTTGVFSFSDGTLNFTGYVRYKGLPDGTLRVKLSGDIVDGSEAFEGAQGKAEAGGKVIFEDGIPIPDVLFKLHIR